MIIWGFDMKSLFTVNISFAFQQGKSFFEGIRFSMQSGRLYFLQGNNGSGKSTLLRILKGTMHPGETLQSTLVLDGIAYSAPDKKFISQVSMVGQDVDTMLSDAFTVAQNLRFANLPQFPRLKKLPNFFYADLLKEFGIDLDKPVHVLSGGQRQIVAIMMALQKPTRILLLDEPTAALDVKNAHMVMNFLEKLAHEQNLFVLMVCHDDNLTNHYGKNTCFLLQEDSTGRRSIIQH